jgi:uncharacterized protein YjbJ (UPF0337 family)
MAATSNRIKGKAKEIEGRMTGDRLREAEGSVQAAVGKATAAVKRGVRKAKAKFAKMKGGTTGRGRGKAKSARKATAST